ncbi:MAG: hypothetical protein H6672_05905 [Anaerolineaceae bacterium]|nr:hypothetical protein [Anaerolineaceae bacterium]
MDLIFSPLNHSARSLRIVQEMPEINRAALFDFAQELWHTRPLLRWVVANIVGWSVGMLAGGWLSGLVNGVIGLGVGGAAAGGIVGLAQWTALHTTINGVTRRGWLVYSLGGGLAAVFPAALAGFALVAGPGIGWLVIGAVFGGIFGGVQWVALRGLFPQQAAWWIGANLVGGGLCGWLALGATLGLPVFCSFGPVVFGLLTGWALRRVAESEFNE